MPWLFAVDLRMTQKVRSGWRPGMTPGPVRNRTFRGHCWLSSEWCRWKDWCEV